MWRPPRNGRSGPLAAYMLIFNLTGEHGGLSEDGVALGIDFKLGGRIATMKNSFPRIMLLAGAMWGLRPGLCSLPGAYASDGQARSCLLFRTPGTD